MYQLAPPSAPAPGSLPLPRRFARVGAVHRASARATISAPMLVTLLGEGLGACAIASLTGDAPRVPACEAGRVTLIAAAALLGVVDPLGGLAARARLALHACSRGIRLRSLIVQIVHRSSGEGRARDAPVSRVRATHMPRLKSRDSAPGDVVGEGTVQHHTDWPATEPMPPLSAPALPQPDADAERAGGGDSSSRESQLPRELAEFLMDLSVAMHKHAIYPRGHPLLDQAVDSVHRSLGRLLLDRPALSIGVARRQLIIEGVATDSSHPMLAELAGKLHRHHIGALKFLPAITRAELSDMLATVGLEAQRDEQPIGMQLELLQSRWSDVKLFPLTYDRLELLDEDGAEERDAAGGMRSGHAAQLWVGLARAAIASDLATQPEHSAMEPEAVAHAIDEHDREQAYDQVIVGYLLQIAREVRQDEGSGLQRRISKLVGSLQPATLKRLLEMGGDSVQRRRFVLDASQGMTVDAVVELVQAAASAEGQTISHSLVRMLTKLCLL
jgi:hypothetical protein